MNQPREQQPNAQQPGRQPNTPPPQQDDENPMGGPGDGEEG